MYYTNKETFVLSADGCMDTERGGLESILAGNDEGAKGCCFSVAMSADGIAVLSSDGCAAAPDGTRLPVSDYSYAELHQAAPQLTPVSQAIELARTCQGKIAITVHDQTMLRQLRMTLRYADCLDDTIIIGLGLVEAARVASANPDLHIMGELPNLPSEIDALVNAAQTTGLFGLRAEPKDLSERLVSACRQAAELARTCQGKIAITVHDQTMLRQLRMTLRYADCLDDTIIIGLGLVEAARVASANPDLHIMGELPNLPSEIDALVNAAQTTGLFGLRAEPKDLSERLVSACRQAGLFTMSRCTDDPNTLAELIRKGVNFIETRRPDITAALLPAGEAEPHGIPLRY